MDALRELMESDLCGNGWSLIWTLSWLAPLMLLCSSSKEASRRPSFFLATRKCWAAESFNPGGRAGGASKVAQHPQWNSLGSCTATEQCLQSCTALHAQAIRHNDIMYKLHVQRERGALPSPTQAGTPDTWMLCGNGWSLIWTLSWLAHGCSAGMDGV